MPRAQRVFVGFAKDLGNALYLTEVLKGLKGEGCRVELVLDHTGAAAQAFSDSESSLATAVSDAAIVVTCVDRRADEDVLDMKIARACGVVVSLSASDFPNLEIDATRVASGLGKPVFGYEDVPGGRFNPGWDAHTSSLTRLFTTMATPDDDRYPITVVGPVQLERYRDLDIAAVGRVARKKLGIKQSAPVVYYIGHPNTENPEAVAQVGRALGAIDRKLLYDVVLVVARHGRELTNPIPRNHDTHRNILRSIRMAGMRVIEASPDYRLPDDHKAAIAPEFKSPNEVTFQELLCSCYSNGVAVSGFATDVLVVAPHIAVPSVLFLPPDTLGKVLQEEKKRSSYPFLDLPQAFTIEELTFKLEEFLIAPGVRESHCEHLRLTFPFPAQNPVLRIQQEILARMAR